MSLSPHLATRLAGEKQHDRGLCSAFRKKYSTSASLSSCYSGGLVQDLKRCSTSLPTMCTREHTYISPDFLWVLQLFEISWNAFSSSSSLLGHQSWNSGELSIAMIYTLCKIRTTFWHNVINQWQAVVGNLHFSCVHTWCTSIKTTVNSRLSTVVTPP